MQRHLPHAQSLNKALPLQTEILSVATANPKYKIDQRDAWEGAMSVFPHLARMEALYTNTGIETRYSCVPADWCQRPHSWEERTEIYQRHALDLLQEVSVRAVEGAGLLLTDIDMLVLNTITGLAIPSLDARLMNRLAFRATLERLPIFGLGCGGGVAGLARAARLAQGSPGANVLFLTVDLCTLCARPNDPSVAMFVSAALFGDGAAAVVLRSGEAKGKGGAVRDHAHRSAQRGTQCQERRAAPGRCSWPRARPGCAGSPGWQATRALCRPPSW